MKKNIKQYLNPNGTCANVCQCVHTVSRPVDLISLLLADSPFIFPFTAFLASLGQLRETGEHAVSCASFEC